MTLCKIYLKNLEFQKNKKQFTINIYLLCLISVKKDLLLCSNLFVKNAVQILRFFLIVVINNNIKKTRPTKGCIIFHKTFFCIFLTYFIIFTFLIFIRCKILTRVISMETSKIYSKVFVFRLQYIPLLLQRTRDFT